MRKPTVFQAFMLPKRMCVWPDFSSVSHALMVKRVESVMTVCGFATKMPAASVTRFVMKLAAPRRPSVIAIVLGPTVTARAFGEESKGDAPPCTTVAYLVHTLAGVFAVAVPEP